MNITFTITVHNFLDAASIEELLKGKKIKYLVDSDCEKQTRRKRTRSGKVTPLILRQVKQHRKNHPTDSNVAIAKAFGLSDTVIGRILNNAHPLQTGEKK